MPKGNAVIGQSGGPTAVINQSLVGILESLRGSDQIDRILGAHHAVSGIVKGDFIDLTDFADDRLDRLARTPSAALGSSRDKPDREYCARIFDAFEQRDVRYFFYIGGNDSSDTCRVVSEAAKEHDYELHAIHVPKTIDNDLVFNDHTPGYGSAAKFVAQAFLGDNLDNRALPGIKIDIVMGRHAGFLTAASVLGRCSGSDGPHLVYVPEVTFDQDKFLADVDRVYKEHGRALIAVSEGIHDESGTPIITKLQEDVERDAHGNVQLSGTGALGDVLADLIRDRLNIKRVRADTFGYLQRSFAGCVSDTDAREAREVGRVAARHALDGVESGSVTIRRTGNDSYAVEYPLVDISDVAAKTRTLDPDWIVDGCDISPAFCDYLRPLVGDLPVVELL